MTPLFSVEGLAGVVFFGFVLLVAAGGLLAVSAVNLIRAVSGLALCMVGMAGINYFLGSPFLALMQLLIYAGAICVAITFAVMLAEPQSAQKKSQTQSRHPMIWLGAMTAGGLLAWGLGALALMTSWPQAAQRVNQGTVEDLGRAMMTTFVVSFELISVILLIAIVGALVLARRGRSRI